MQITNLDSDFLVNEIAEDPCTKISCGFFGKRPLLYLFLHLRDLIVYRQLQLTNVKKPGIVLNQLKYYIRLSIRVTTKAENQFK